MTYIEKLKDPRWQKKRLKILDRDNFTCKYCDDKKSTLHVHHLKYGQNPWEVENEHLISLCEHCHSLIEFLKKNKHWERDFITKIIKIKCTGISVKFIIFLHKDICLYTYNEREGSYIRDNYIDEFDIPLIFEYLNSLKNG